MVNDQNVLFKINPENGVEAIKKYANRTLNSLLAGDRDGKVNGSFITWQGITL
jgi:hypothetical protein